MHAARASGGGVLPRRSPGRRTGALLVVGLILAACSSDAARPPAAASTVAGVPGTATTAASTTSLAEAPAPPASVTAASVTPAAPSAIPAAYELDVGRQCDPGAVTGAQPAVDLVMWAGLAEQPQAALESAIRDFNVAQREVHVTVERFPHSAAVFEALRAADRAPDLVVVDHEAFLPLAYSGLATSVQACIDADPAFAAADLVPATAATYALDGEQLALPLTASAPVLIYDRAVFRRAGLDPDAPPRTLAELRAALVAIVGQGVTADGLTLVNRDWYVSQWMATAGVPLALPDNGRSVPAGDVSLVGTVAEDFLAYLQELVGDGLASYLDNGDGNADLLRLVAAENRSAMTVHTSGSLGLVYDLAPNVAGVDVGVGPLPGPGPGSLVGGTSLWITTREPQAVAAAWRVASLLTSVPVQATFAVAGYAPVRQSAVLDPTILELWAQRPGLRVAFDQLSAVPEGSAHLAAVVGTESHVRFRLNWAVEDVIREVSARAPAEALADAERDIDRLLRSFYEVVAP